MYKIYKELVEGDELYAFDDDDNLLKGVFLRKQACGNKELHEYVIKVGDKELHSRTIEHYELDEDYRVIFKEHIATGPEYLFYTNIDGLMANIQDNIKYHNHYLTKYNSQIKTLREWKLC